MHNALVARLRCPLMLALMVLAVVQSFAILSS
jgi:hypothetical protein